MKKEHYSPWERFRLRLGYLRILLRYAWRASRAYADDDERIMYGDPNAPEPVGVLHAGGDSVRIDEQKPRTLFGLPVVESDALNDIEPPVIGAWCETPGCLKADGHDGDCVVHRWSQP